MAEIGKVHEITRNFDFEWRINDFSSLSEEDGEDYYSPSFLFANKSFYLGICPNGDSMDNSQGYLAVYLFKDSSDSTVISVTCSIGLKAVDGKKIEEVQFTNAFDEQSSGCGPHCLLKRSEIFEKKSYLMPSDVVTLVCSLKYSKFSEDTDGTAKRECSYCKLALNAKCISSHEDMCLDKPIRCPTCNDDVHLRKWYGHKCQMARVTANKKLLEDLTDIFNNDEHSDVTIKVKDQEFRLHRNILSGRSAFFRSMFNSDMKEKTTGIVSISECDPNIFKLFVYFLYTGKTPALSNDNVCALYEIADKYQDDQLKADCLTFMKNKISTDSFCDFIVLALRHDEKDLFQVATELFCQSTIEIIECVKWQTFIREYPTESNELHIKAHKAIRQVKYP